MACPDMYESNSACGRFRLLALRFLMNSKLGAVRGVRAGPEVPAAEVGEVVALLPRPQPALVTEPEGHQCPLARACRGWRKHLVMKLMLDQILGGLAFSRM